MIKPVSFVDLSRFTAAYVVEYRKHAVDNLLQLRSPDEDFPILEGWKSAKAVLARIQAGAAPLLGGRHVTLGRVWIETLDGNSGTPWLQEEDAYAQAHIRTRTCMIPTHDAYTYSGNFRELLNVGVINFIEHRILCSDTNFSPYPRTHLIVDIKRPEPDVVVES